jgi:polysaccharide chain length determinant protein (PEP-CTERM system associated)
MLEALIHLKSLLRGIWNYRWTGLITALIVGLITGLGAALVPSKYEASARVYVDTQSILNEALKGVAVQPNGAEQMSMVARTLISRPIVERVMLAAQMNLDATDQRGRDAIVDQLLKDIEFKAVGAANNNLFSIAYKHKKPETARTIVQSLVGIFVERSLGDARKDADQSERFLNEQIKEYEQRLVQSENTLKEFKIKNMGMIPGEGGRDFVGRIQDIDNQIRQARLELRQATNVRDSLRKQLSGESPTMGNSDETTTTVPTGVRARTDLEDRLDAAEKRLDEYRSRLTDEHPDVTAAKRVVDGLRTQREKERTETRAPGTTTTTRSPVPNPVYKELRVQFSDAEAQVASQASKLADYESRLIQIRESATQVPQVEAALTQLTREYETNRIKHQKLIESRESVQISNKRTGAAGVGEIRIVDPPRVSQKPVSPNRLLLMIGALAVSTLAGIAAALFKDQSKPTFFDVRALRTFTGMPLLGGVSYVMSQTGRGAMRRELLMFLTGVAAFLLVFSAAIIFFGIRQLSG